MCLLLAVEAPLKSTDAVDHHVEFVRHFGGLGAVSLRAPLDVSLCIHLRFHVFTLVHLNVSFGQKFVPKRLGNAQGALFAAWTSFELDIFGFCLDDIVEVSGPTVVAHVVIAGQ